MFVKIVVLVFMAFLFSYCFVDCKYHLTDECWSAQTYHETGLFQVNVNTSIFLIVHIVKKTITMANHSVWKKTLLIVEGSIALKTFPPFVVS